MSTLEKKAGIGADQLDEILGSHAIDPAALRTDDFDTFFDSRKQRLLELISLAMGKPAIVDDDQLEQELALFEDEPEDLEDLPDLLEALGPISGEGPVPAIASFPSEAGQGSGHHPED